MVMGLLHFIFVRRGNNKYCNVFVENVRQEPTTAYSVDGTISFFYIPWFWDKNIYVVNRGPLQLSAKFPAAQALEASTGILLAT